MEGVITGGWIQQNWIWPPESEHCWDTWLGLNPASKTDGYPFEDRAYNTEVIYSGSNQDYDSQDEKSDTVDEGTEHFCHILQIAPLSDYKCLVALTVVTSKNKSRSVIKL